MPRWGGVAPGRNSSGTTWSRSNRAVAMSSLRTRSTPAGVNRRSRRWSSSVRTTNRPSATSDAIVAGQQTSPKRSSRTTRSDGRSAGIGAMDRFAAFAADVGVAGDVALGAVVADNDALTGADDVAVVAGGAMVDEELV